MLIVICCLSSVGNHPRSGVLLSVIVILGAGDCSVLGLVGPAGGRSELLDLDLACEVCLISCISLEGGLDILPDLVLTSSVSSSGNEAVFELGVAHFLTGECTLVSVGYAVFLTCATELVLT